MLNKRIISAVIGMVLLILIVVSSNIVLNISIAIIAIIALYELFSALKVQKNFLPAYLGYFSAVVIVFSDYFHPGWMRLLVYVYVALLLLLMLIYYQKIDFNQIAVTFFAVIYICYFMAHIIFTRDLNNGSILIWLIFLGAWATDTFAFFVGSFLGKKKLLPDISPKKTVAGALGGIVGCGLSFLLYGYIVHILGNYSVHYINLLLLGLLSSIFSQLGDLVASCIKRQYGVKDFGTIMPGHGGILDRFDSILFVAPVVYYFVVHFTIIV